jgi:hypothetical protein
LLVDPTSAGFSYATLGAWTYAISPASSTRYGAHFHLGSKTSGRDIPVSGTASFSGVMLGTFADGAAIYDVAAAARAQADFASRSVTLNTEGSRKTPIGSSSPMLSDPSLDLSGTLRYPAQTNTLTGTLTAGDMAGPSNAQFYGPAAVELGGSYAVQNGDGSREMKGSYVLRKQ